MTCRNCGAEVGAEDKFCPVCGVPTAEKKRPNFCMHCGSRLSADDRFCAGCGCQVGEPKPAVTESDPNISASRLYYRPKRDVLDVRTVVWLTLLLLCAGVFIAGTLLSWWKL